LQAIESSYVAVRAELIEGDLEIDAVRREWAVDAAAEESFGQPQVNEEER
jgi:hypothetical protein